MVTNFNLIPLRYTVSLFSTLSSEIFLLQHRLIDNAVLAIDVMRENILLDAMREARKKKFDVRKRIKVCLYYFLVEAYIF